MKLIEYFLLIVIVFLLALTLIGCRKQKAVVYPPTPPMADAPMSLAAPSAPAFTNVTVSWTHPDPASLTGYNIYDTLVLPAQWALRTNVGKIVFSLKFPSTNGNRFFGVRAVNVYGVESELATMAAK